MNSTTTFETQQASKHDMMSAKSEGIIKSIRLQNFTVFTDVTLKFAKNLNVIIGENNLGKSHLLKLLYAITMSNRNLDNQGIKNEIVNNQRNAFNKNQQPVKDLLELRLDEKLVNVFNPDSVGRLVRRRQGLDKCSIVIEFEDDSGSLDFNFVTNATKIHVTRCPTSWYGGGTPVYLPAHELLSVFPWFRFVYDAYKLYFDETWYDTCKLLSSPQLRGRRSDDVSKLLDPLEKEMGGSVILKGDCFYLYQHGNNTEIPLAAEGIRKLAMLAWLISTGSLRKSSCLYWDEPESNLNPKLIRVIAKAIFHISQSGIQVFVATHSLFLLKELKMLSDTSTDYEIQYFSLSKGVDEVINICSTDDINEIEPLTMLDEEIKQSDRYIEVS